MPKAPYFPLYGKNWISGRHVVSMSGDGIKAYMFLLCESWDQIPRATIPNDDSEIRSMARCSTEVWERIKCEVLERFLTGQCDEHKGRLVAKFLIEVSRKFENNQRFKNKNAKRTRIKREVNATLDIDIDINNDLEKAVVLSFFSFRKGMGKPFKTKVGMQMFLKRLRSLSGGDIPKMKMIVEQSIANEWQGIFPLKDENKPDFTKREAKKEPYDGYIFREDENKRKDL